MILNGGVPTLIASQLIKNPAILTRYGQLPQQQCGMATLRDVQNRLKSIKNIGKITKSMKMIASTRLNKAQRNMEAARAFANASNSKQDH